MAFQDSNQQPYPQQPQSPQSPPQQQAWGQQPQVPQQPATQSSWGAPDQAPAPGGAGGSQGWGWGSQQPQMPQMPPQAGYGFGQGAAAPGQGFGQPQDQPAPGFAPPQPQMPQPPGYPSGGYTSGPGGYYRPQSDFGSGVGYGPGYPGPGPQPRSGLATASLWLGILGGWGLINLVVSILAINDTAPGKKTGRGKALTGLCLTLAWTVVWIGVFVAVSGHTASIAVTAAPTDPFATSAVGGAGAGGIAPTASTGPVPSAGSTAPIYLTGATDPGCVTVQTAFDEMQASKGSSTSVSAFMSALQNGAGQSGTAGSQIGTVESDWSGGKASQTQMVDDMRAMETACGMKATYTDPQ